MSSALESEKLDPEDFETWPDVLNVLDRHDAHWGWLREEQVSGGAASIRDRILNASRTLRRQLATLQAQNHQLRAGVNQINNASDLVHPASPLAILFDDAKEAAGTSAALFVLGFKAGWVGLSEAHTPEDLAGAMWLVSPATASHAAFSEQLRRERTNLRRTVRQIADEARQAAETADAEWNAVLARAQQVAQRWAAGRSRRLRAASRTWRDRHANSEASIKAVETAYREQMGLKAPVEYWQSKAEAHRTSERWARVWVLLFFPLALVGMAIAFNNTAVSLINAAQAAQADGAAPFPSAVFIVASAGLASCAGLVFWVGRLLTKLYLSQHHLRQDAEERATMTQTYLALIENDAASTDDRQVILNALFRNTPDGIVKEDGGLDPSIAAALGKFLAK